MHSTSRLRGSLALSACLLLGALCPTLAQTPAPTGLAAIVKGSLGTTVQKVLAADNKTANAWADDLGKSGLATPDLSAKQKEILTTFVTDVADYKTCLARAYRLLPLEEPDRDDKLKGQGYGDNTPWDDADAGFRRIIAAESAAETPNSPDFFGSTAFQNYRAALFAKADALKNLRDLTTLAGDAAGDRKALEDYAAGAGVLTVSKEPGAKFSTIDSASEAAEAGSLVTVMPGTYSQSNPIVKPIFIEGGEDLGEVTLAETRGQGQCFDVRSAFLDLTNLKLQYYPPKEGSIQGVFMVQRGHIILDHCDIDTTGMLIQRWAGCSALDIQFSHCNINQNSNWITVLSEQGDRVVFRNCNVTAGLFHTSPGSFLTSRSCVFGIGLLVNGEALLADCTSGPITIGRTGAVTGSHCRITSGRYALEILRGANAAFEDCEFTPEVFVYNNWGMDDSKDIPTITERFSRCRFGSGVTVTGNACSLQDCDISWGEEDLGSSTNLDIHAGGVVNVIHSRFLADMKKLVPISENGHETLKAHPKQIVSIMRNGVVTFSKCDLRGLGPQWIASEPGSTVKLIDTQVDAPAAKAPTPQKPHKTLPKDSKARKN